jgi:hypothetical protein
MDAETGSCLERSHVDRDGLCQFSLAGLQQDIAELQAVWGTRCNAGCKLFCGAHADLIGRSITAAILLLVIHHASMPLPTAAATFSSPPSSLPSCRTYKWPLHICTSLGGLRSVGMHTDARAEGSALKRTHTATGALRLLLRGGTADASLSHDEEGTCEVADEDRPISGQVGCLGGHAKRDQL